MAKLGKVDLEKLRLDVQVKFDKIREALNVREKLLLRQIDVILTSRQHKNASVSTTNGKIPPIGSEPNEIKFITENEENVLNSIRSFGKFNLDNINLALQDLYINEDYISPAIDHETMYKCLSNSSDGSNGNDEESIVVDFSTNKKLIRDNVNSMNESIINITLNEAKELIRKSHKSSLGTATAADTPVMPLHLEGILDDDDGMPAAPTHSKSSQTVENKRKSRFKPKITINNCNGTINLKNISNLTINCATDDSFKAVDTDTDENSPNNNVEPPKSTTVTTTTSTSSGGSNSSGNSAASSNEISPKRDNNQRMDIEYNDDDRSATCEFYNRLLNEIKNSLKQKTPKVVTDNRRFVVGTDEDEDDEEPQPDMTVTSTTTDDANGNDTTQTSQTVTAPNKKLILRNFENLKIILEASDNSDVMRPVQIEQWLAEIISETEIEPMQNTDILEHSKIHTPFFMTASQPPQSHCSHKSLPSRQKLPQTYAQKVPGSN